MERTTAQQEGANDLSISYRDLYFVVEGSPRVWRTFRDENPHFWPRATFRSFDAFRSVVLASEMRSCYHRLFSGVYCSRRRPRLRL